MPRAVWTISFSATCSYTTFGMALGSLVQTESLNEERFVLFTMVGLISCTQQLGVKIFVVVPSA